ncbi:MAG: RNA polymerase sigma factor [Bacteroidetes bacterium]|nr:RNA polymerase sigma factor [Bacteroidota bacterium]
MFFFKFKHIKKLDDLELVSGYRATKKSLYLETLFGRYFHLIYGVCLKYLKDTSESKEAVLEIFEKLEKDILKNELISIKSWLFTVSRNHCLSIIKSKKKDILSANVADVSLLSDVIAEEDLHESSYGKLSGQVSLFIEQLKIGQKECIQMFYMERKSYKEITEITGYDLKQVKSYLQNGKRSLALLINEQMNNEKIK